MESDFKFSILFAAIRNVFKKIGNNNLKELDLTSSQMNVLLYIFNNLDSEINQKDIEKNLYLKNSTVTDILNRLESKGFVSRTASEKDGRYKKIILTDKGEDVREIIIQKALIFEKYFTKGMSKGEAEMLFELLEKVLKNISEEC